jgi:hypothetical protein
MAYFNGIFFLKLKKANPLNEKWACSLQVEMFLAKIKKI